jgi:hypothetical protein
MHFAAGKAGGAGKKRVEEERKVKVVKQRYERLR